MFVVDLQTLSAFGLAPARYVFANQKGPLLPDFIIMDRIDGMTLFDYIEFGENIQGLEGYKAEIKLRLPGLRVSENNLI